MTLYDLLHHEIANGTQRSAGALYAVCFLQKGQMASLGYDEMVMKANRAIQDRWSRTGLDRVKGIAWSIAGALATDDEEEAASA